MSKRDTAKLLKFTRGQAQKRSASATGKAFTQKQSHFARRSEEESAKREQFALGGDGAAGGFGADVDSKFASAPKASTSEHHSAIGRILGRGASAAKRKNTYGLDEFPAAVTQGQQHLGEALTASNPQAERDDDTGEPLSGKRARFEDMLDRSRDAKADKKVLRQEQEKQIDHVDKAFDDISGLLTTKSKQEEAQEAFFQLGSEETRARLADFFDERKESKGREFVLGANKKIVKVDNDAAQNAKVTMVGNTQLKQKQEAKKARLQVKQQQQQQQQQQEEDAAPAAAASSAAAPAAASSASSDPRAAALRETAGTATADDDGFDKLLGQMLFSRKAHAGDRVETEEDALLGRFQDEIVDLDKMRQDAAGNLVPDVQDTSRREWIQRGGDDVYRMGDDEQQQQQGEFDEDEEGDDYYGDQEDDEHQQQLQKEKEEKLNPVDVCLADLETAMSTKSADRIRASLTKLHEMCAMRPRMGAESFRLLLLGIHTHHSERRALTPFHLLVLRAAATMFPMTDIARHPVAAPLSALLPTLMMSGPSLDAPRTAAVALFLTGTMIDLLRGRRNNNSNTDTLLLQNRKPFFATEPFVVLCNVLALQLPLTELAPRGKAAKIVAPFPVLPRAAEPVLALSAKTAAAAAEEEESLSLHDLLFGTDKTISAAKVLRTAYEMLSAFVDEFLAHSPSAPSLLEPLLVDFLFPRLAAALPDAVKRSIGHTALAASVERIVADVVAERAPLAMRTFRPRPLRQYEPLLVDDSGDESKARRVMKKELREGKKRVIRSVQATAAVERRQAERDTRVEDAHRSAKLKSLMSELQEQQQVMNYVDSINAKGKGKPLKGLSGAPTGDQSAAGAEDAE